MTNKEQPKVTVGLFVHNGEKYIEQTVNSILSQDATNIKIIISDNASTDGTEKICRRIQSTYKNIIYTRHIKNRGALFNSSYLLEHCDTPYFVWASDHDLWAENYISTLLSTLENNPKSVLAYSDITRIDENGNIVGQERSSSDNWSTINLSVLERVKVFFWKRKSCIMIYGLLRADVAKKLTPLPKILGMDNLFLLRLMLAGDYIYNGNTCLFYRDVRPIESPGVMWSRQKNSLQIHSNFPPWWRVCIGYAREILQTESMSRIEKRIALKELLWVMQKRFGETLLAENKAMYVGLKIINKILFYAEKMKSDNE